MKQVQDQQTDAHTTANMRCLSDERQSSVLPRLMSPRRPVRSALGLAIAFLLCSGIQAGPLVQERETGPVKIRLTLDPDQPRIGDTLTLTIEVVAEQDVEVLMPDFGEALDRFTIVDFAPRESIDDEGRNLFRQTYRLDPPMSGKLAIPPILIEYVDRREGEKPAPDDLDAYEVLTERIPFEVASVLPSNAKAELKPPLGELAPIEPAQPSIWPWVLVTIVLLAAASVPLWKAFIAAQRRARRRSAYDVASSQLEKLLRAPRKHESQIPPFYVGLTTILRKYIEDRYDLRAPELTTEEFLASMGQSPDFSSEHQSLLRDVLKQADLVKFARALPEETATQEIIESVRKFLNDTRANAPLLDDEDSNQESQAGGESSRTPELASSSGVEKSV